MASQHSPFCNRDTCLRAKSLSHVHLFATPRTGPCQAPLSMRFSRQEYWSGYHVLLQGIFPAQRWNPSVLCLLNCQAGSLSLASPGKPCFRNAEAESEPSWRVASHIVRCRVMVLGRPGWPRTEGTAFGQGAPGRPGSSAMLGMEPVALTSVWGCTRLVLFPMCSLGQVPLLSGLPSLSIKWGCELRRIVTGMSVSSAPLGQAAGGFLPVYWGPRNG